MRRCRTTASTSAFQAEDVGSTPITCSIKQARAKSSGLLAATTAYADVAELADALDSGSSGSDTVGVQVPSSAPEPRSTDRGFFVVSVEKLSGSISGQRLLTGFGTNASGACFSFGLIRSEVQENRRSARRRKRKRRQYPAKMQSVCCKQRSEGRALEQRINKKAIFIPDKNLFKK